MKSVRIIVIIAAVLAAAAVVFFVIRPGNADGGTSASLYVPEERGVAVETSKAEIGMIIPSVKASGLIRGKNEAVLISETRGIVNNIYKNIGERLEAGDPVLSVDSDIAELNMLQTEQQYRSAEIDYESVKRAYEKGSASETEMLRAKSQLAGAEAQYRNAVKSYENSVIKAPYSGYLADFESSAGIGNYISEGARIGRVIDLSEIRIDLFLGDDEISRIKEGAPVVIESAGMVLDGNVEAVALSSDRSTGSFRVIIAAENPYGTDIKSGFAADVSINQLNAVEHIIVSASSVFKLNGKSYVYVIIDEVAELRPVKTGSVSGNRMEVLEGLESGDVVASSGFKSLKDGSKVITGASLSEGGGQ